MGARHVNANLVLKARREQASLATALDGRGTFLLDARSPRRGTWIAIVDTRREFKLADTAVERLLRAVEELDEGAREEWNACTVREFHIGLEADVDEASSSTSLNHDLLRRIVALGGSVTITVYHQETFSVADDSTPSDPAR